MRLKELVKDIKKGNINLNPEIKNIAYDSRKISKNSLFVCLEGHNYDGHKFIDCAISRGARAVVYQRDDSNFKKLYPDISFIKVKNTRAALADLASNFYNKAAEKINLIGITGTNGKTTTSFLTEHIINTAGFKTGLIGTIHIKVNNKIFPALNTTPQSLDIYQNLHKMVNSGAKYAVMEVSSHGLDQSRVHGLEFKVATFTNLTLDHLDYHKDLKNYFLAKLKLFKNLSRKSFSVLNTDDKYGRKILKITSSRIITYGIKGKPDISAEEIKLTTRYSAFKITVKGKVYPVKLKLAGFFNVYNALASFGTAYALGIDTDTIVKALNTAKSVRGRFQLIGLGQDFDVVIDYAHTPDGLENLLTSARGVTSGKIITVFGCGGNRDKTKRPIMGEIAARLSDICIITSDNPRNEKPENIIKEVEGGVLKVAKKYKKITERTDAIYKAVNMAEKGDMVIIAGKGHETYQIFKDKTIHFDDAEVAKTAIRGRIEKI